jgi:hypothetical protein
VKVNIEFNSLAHVFDGTTSPAMSDASLYVDYIYLDTDERRRFAQVTHEYLIEQLQFTGEESVSQGANKLKLNFNHPTKELIWVTRASEKEDDLLWMDFSANDGSGNPTTLGKLQLNGHDRFSERLGSYFRDVQPFQHHENIPTDEGINVYSFGLKPEEHQPSGTCNFSRIDNATLQLSQTVSASAKCFVYARNYNVLRIMSGINFTVFNLFVTMLHIRHYAVIYLLCQRINLEKRLISELRACDNSKLRETPKALTTIS